MKRNISILIIISALFFYSCKTNTQKKENKNIITKRIQYDVNIKSPDVDFDWWVQNIEGQDRENFVKKIISAAYSGKVKTYDACFNTPLSVDQVRAIENYSDTVTLQRSYSPYEEYDTIIGHQINLNQITRIRFLEEWYFEENKYEVKKKVLGIAPMIKKYNEEGVFRGYMPLFWIYFDKDYPAKYKVN